MLTEQVLSCRKVKYGMAAWKAAKRARRVKTNFKTEPQAMIWRENPIYVVTHNNYSNAFTLSFGGGQRSSLLLLQFFLLQAWTLSVYAGEKEL